MPKRRAAWASWNYIGSGEGEDDPIAVSYWMNGLQELSTDQLMVVTLNPSERPAHVHRELTYRHPQFDLKAIKAQYRRDGSKAAMGSITQAPTGAGAFTKTAWSRRSGRSKRWASRSPFRVRWSADERSRDRPDGARPAQARAASASVQLPMVRCRRPLPHPAEGALVHAQPLRILEL